jgi:hypothetical protein
MFPGTGEIESNAWANAKPYLYDPLPKLPATVPDLKGLQSEWLRLYPGEPDLVL